MAIPISFFAWFIFYPVYGIAASYFGVSYDFVGLPGPTYGSGFFWLMTLLMPVLCLLRDYIWKYVLRMYRPRSYHIVQEIQKFNIPDYRPRMERFRKAVHKVRMIQRLKNNRGYAFSQNEGGQDKVIRSYDTTRIKPLG
jgi:phospholipid-transporting ATPase